MRGAILTLALATLLVACGGDDEPRADPPDRTAAREERCPATLGAATRVTTAPVGTESRVRLAPGMELEPTKATIAAGRRGPPMVVTGVVRDESCAPLAGATVHAWQTTHAGRYGPEKGGRDVCCYLQGSALTDADGRYAFDSVVPGTYGGNPPHVHMEIGHPEAEGVVTEVVIEGRPERAELDVVLAAR